jgi:hypothetical protein
MLWRILANALVVLHLAFVAFAVFGAYLAWRWRRLLVLHVPALCWAVWIELSGRICPLTPWENELREHAGEAGYQGGFVEHYIVPVIYPSGLTRHTQWILASVLIAVNVAAYAVLMRKAVQR